MACGQSGQALVVGGGAVDEVVGTGVAVVVFGNVGLPQFTVQPAVGVIHPRCAATVGSYEVAYHMSPP